MRTAAAKLSVKTWDEKPVVNLESGSKLTRATVIGAYSGDVEGDATSESVMWYSADGAATFVGLERIVGRVGGRSGSFVLRSTGAYDGNEAKADVEVVPGSGTGDLSGLTGGGRFAAQHGTEAVIELNYRFE